MGQTGAAGGGKVNKKRSVDALNEDSDIQDMEMDQNDGDIVGGSGSEKGDIMWSKLFKPIPPIC